MAQVLTERLASEFALYVLATGILCFLFLPFNFEAIEKIVPGNFSYFSIDQVLQPSLANARDLFLEEGSVDPLLSMTKTLFIIVVIGLAFWGARQKLMGLCAFGGIPRAFREWLSRKLSRKQGQHVGRLLVLSDLHGYGVDAGSKFLKWARDHDIWIFSGEFRLKTRMATSSWASFTAA